MWNNKSRSSKPQKSYDYFKRLKAYTNELVEIGETTQEFMDFIFALHTRCQNIIDKEEKRIDDANEVK